MPLFMMLASLSNVARLIRLKEQAQDSPLDHDGRQIG